jgi:glutaminyl-tRNA synthetase
MHWLSARDLIPAEIRIYNQLFSKPNPDAGNLPPTSTRTRWKF